MLASSDPKMDLFPDHPPAQEGGDVRGFPGDNSTSIFIMTMCKSKTTRAVSWMLWDIGPRPRCLVLSYYSTVHIQARRFVSN